MKIMEEKRTIGCCGVDCNKCRSLIRGVCMGCKGGYDTGERYINKTRCKIKLCCFRDKKLAICTDCSKVKTCDILNKKLNSILEKRRKKYKHKKIV